MAQHNVLNYIKMMRVSLDYMMTEIRRLDKALT